MTLKENLLEAENKDIKAKLKKGVSTIADVIEKHENGESLTDADMKKMAEFRKSIFAMLK